MNNNKCKNCGTWLPRHSSARRQFCNDLCRLQHNRAQKKKPNFEAKYNELVRSMHDSIIRLEKASKKAEGLSQEMTRPLPERLGLIAMFKEKESIAKELKLLLEMSGAPDSWQSYLNTTDPTKFD